MFNCKIYPTSNIFISFKDRPDIYWTAISKKYTISKIGIFVEDLARNKDINTKDIQSEMTSFDFGTRLPHFYLSKGSTF